jgi:AcrR family transcriptional regulator
MSTPSQAPNLTSARSIRCHDAVVAATQELLREGSLPAATIDAIAERSGVSKATIYKHWPSRIAIAAESYGLMMADTITMPDHGNIADDLTEQLRKVGDFYASPRGLVFRQLLAACVDDASGAEYFRRYFLAQRRAQVVEMWQRAIVRHEVDRETDIDLVIDILFGPLVFRLMSGHTPFTGDEAVALARAALHGVLSVP